MLRNEGEEPVEKLPVRLYVGSREKAMASADIGAKGRALIEIPFTLDKEGWQDARLEITDYPITFDDQLFFSFQVTGRHRILRIHHAEGNPFLHALFAKDSSIEYQEIPIGQMDYSLLDRQDLVILDRIVDAGGGFLQNISRYVEEGGNLLLIPSTQSKQVLENRINRALQLPLFTALDTHRSRISEIQLEHALYRNTFDKVDENMQLPAIYKHYRMAQDLQDGKEVPLRLENQDEFLSQLPRGEGSVYLLSVPLDDTFGEWQRHALFVPTLYNMAVFRHKSLRLYYTIGQNEPIPFIGESLPARAVPEIRKGTFSCIPEMRSQSSHNALFAHDQINEAGNYVLVYQGDTLQHLSFNDARTESVMQYWSEKALKEQFKGDRYKEVFSQQYPTSSAWAHGLLHQPRQSTLFVWLALLFLLLEGILLRIWKI